MLFYNVFQTIEHNHKIIGLNSYNVVLLMFRLLEVEIKSTTTYDYFRKPCSFMEEILLAQKSCLSLHARKR